MEKYYIDKTVTAKKGQQVLDLLNNTPNGVVIDADTIRPAGERQLRGVWHRRRVA